LGPVARVRIQRTKVSPGSCAAVTAVANENLMSKCILRFSLLPVAFVAGVALAQYPVLDEVADQVVQKYQSASCEELRLNRGKHTPKQQEMVNILRSDPTMR
jgi:hypothetical protein